MRVNIVTEGLFKPENFRAWAVDKQKSINRAVGAGMKEAGTLIARRANDSARRALNAKRGNFPGIRAKLYDRDKSRPPSLLIGSKIPWLGIHERGGTIRGRMLIPFGKRIGQKKFRQVVASLMRSGNAYFRNVRGKAILFAENIAENKTELAGFKRNFRKAIGGGRIKKGADVPIATLVTSITIRKRLGLDRAVRAGLPQLARAIQNQLSRI